MVCSVGSTADLFDDSNTPRTKRLDELIDQFISRRKTLEPMLFNKSFFRDYSQ